jgi:hypothetical protein
MMAALTLVQALFDQVLVQENTIFTAMPLRSGDWHSIVGRYSIR